MAAILVAAGLFWFQPWRLVTNRVVNDVLPISAPATAEVQTKASGSPAMASGSVPNYADELMLSSGAPRAASPAVTALPVLSSLAPQLTGSVPSPKAARAHKVSPTAAAAQTAFTRTSAAQPTVLAIGTLIAHEHDTSGKVRIVRLPDGHRVLALEDLRTSDGPALHVWLTDAQVTEGEGGWKVFDDGRYTDVDALKGNIGNQVYVLPDELDLSQYSSVSIWCERFAVSFGAAELGKT